MIPYTIANKTQLVVTQIIYFRALCEYKAWNDCKCESAKIINIRKDCIVQGMLSVGRWWICMYKLHVSEAERNYNLAHA